MKIGELRVIGTIVRDDRHLDTKGDDFETIEANGNIRTNDTQNIKKIIEEIIIIKTETTKIDTELSQGWVDGTKKNMITDQTR